MKPEELDLSCRIRPTTASSTPPRAAGPSDGQGVRESGPLREHLFRSIPLRADEASVRAASSRRSGGDGHVRRRVHVGGRWWCAGERIRPLSGTGSQVVGMGKRSPTLSARRARSSSAPTRFWGFPSPRSALRDRGGSHPHENTQPALLVTSVAAARVLERNRDPPPRRASGHSAANSPRTWPRARFLQDGLKLIRRRGELMAGAGKERRARWRRAGAGSRAYRAVLAKGGPWPRYLAAGDFNSPGQVVLSGTPRRDRGRRPRRREGGREESRAVTSSAAFHSRAHGRGGRAV